MDFAVRKGVSLSTLRRHIKANKVLYKVENGRYLLHDPDADPQANGEEVTAPSAPLRAFPVKSTVAHTSVAAPVFAAPRHEDSLQSRFQKLEKELQRAREENAELKTLIAFYEEHNSTGRQINN